MTRLLLLLAVLPYFVFSGATLSYAQDDAEVEQLAEQDESEAEAVDVDEAAETEAERDAEEEKKKEARRASSQIKTMDPDLRKLNNNLADLTEDLDDNNRRHFYTLYNNNNLISTVEYVRGHVGEAIDACSENNPAMEEDLRARYKEWTDAVNEKLGEAKAQVENMVLAQDYAADREINTILKQANDLRAKTQKNVERIPVTTPEACEYLLNKMDETEANMLTYLGHVLVAMPQSMD